MSGILVIDKPAGLTSHDVVARVRHIIHERRVGHTGTLDPFATGALVVLVGRATRLAQFLNDAEKEYHAIIRLGYETDTGDRTGNRLSASETRAEAPPKTSWTEAVIESALESLRGEIQQIPPMYSAKRIEGTRLYELARRGEEVERRPINICIYEFAPLRPDGQLIKDNGDGTFDFHARVVCSSGTYVRTLAADFGKRLGVQAHLAELRRTRVGDFQIEKAITLEALRTSYAEEALGMVMVTPESALSRLDFVHLSKEDEQRVRHGREVIITGVQWNDGAKVRMCDSGGRLLAVGDFDATSETLHPRVVIAD